MTTFSLLGAGVTLLYCGWKDPGPRGVWGLLLAVAGGLFLFGALCSYAIPALLQ